MSAGAVPMSANIVKIISDGLTRAERESFDAYLGGVGGDGEKYRQAFRWLGLRKPPQMRDRIIQLATLRAYQSLPSEKNAGLLNRSAQLEGEIDKWNLPPGQASLGRILAGLSQEYRGPVLTTNFDPLTEIAMRRAGVEPVYYVNADDSSFLTNLRVQSSPTVLHLHGFWRDSVTLSMSEQLEARRPAIEGCIRHILDKYTLVVLGYGAWPDVVTTILQEQIAAQQSTSMDILWAFRATPTDIEKQVASNPILSAISQAQGNVQFYAGVDANAFLPALEKRIAPSLSYPDSQRKRAGKAALAGWVNVTPEFLEAADTPVHESSAVTFLDGRLPNWSDAVNPFVVQRDIAVEITNVVKADLPLRESSVSILLGASGEGKSTILLQVAAMLAISDEMSPEVIFLSGDHLGPVEDLIKLPSDKSRVLIVDDAYRFVGPIQLLAKRIRELGKPGLHLVLASGDSDWYATGAHRYPWSKQVRTHNFTVAGLERPDAVAFIQTWRKLGADALGDLAELDDVDDQVEDLLEASRDPGVDGVKASLLGALLVTRYGDGLRGHIGELMGRLEMRLIQPAYSERTLLDALVAIALPHSYGVLDLEPQVLGDVLGVDLASLFADVLEPLGEEAAVAFTSGRVVVRHYMIATVIIDLCLERQYDLETTVDRLIYSAAKRLRQTGDVPRLSTVTYLGSKMTDIPKLALTAVAAARRADPKRLSYVSHASAVHRRSNDVVGAQELNAGAVTLLDDETNWSQGRGFLTEWAVVEGNLGNWACNALLASMALGDEYRLGLLYPDKVQRAVSCLMLSLRRLDEISPDGLLVEALAAGTVVARRIGNVTQRSWLLAAERHVVGREGEFPDRNDRGLVDCLQSVYPLLKRSAEHPLGGLEIPSSLQLEALSRLLAR